MENWSYSCESCGHTEPLETEHWRCPACGSAFGIDGPNRLDPEQIDPMAPGLWRYGHLLPVEPTHAVSLGEGMTPLIPGKLAGLDVRFKLDALLPTGSFKDRGAALLAAHLKRIGRRRVIVDSSGNAAAALSGYSAAAGLECSVFAPTTTSPGKLVQSRAFGASVTLVDGNRDDVARAAQEAAARDESACYASHNWHPVFVEGVKTWMLEVWEQLGGRQPSLCFVPTGGGSALVGAWRGLQALPGQPARLFAAQPGACSPVVDAIERDGPIQPVMPGSTIAEGTRIGSPSRGRQILAAIQETNGGALAVSELEIVETLRELWGQGLYVEPTAAVGAAACRQMVLAGDSLPDSEIVVLLTGSGLKATETIEKLLTGRQ